MKILLQKQRKAIEKLEEEKTELLTNLNCAKCPANETKDEKNTSRLKQLLQQHDKLDQEIKYEKSQLSELEFQIKKVEKEVYTIKRKYRVKESNLEETREQQRAQQQLENRLDVVSAAGGAEEQIKGDECGIIGLKAAEMLHFSQYHSDVLKSLQLPTRKIPIAIERLLAIAKVWLNLSTSWLIIARYLREKPAC